MKAQINDMYFTLNQCIIIFIKYALTNLTRAPGFPAGPKGPCGPISPCKQEEKKW